MRQVAIERTRTQPKADSLRTLAFLTTDMDAHIASFVYDKLAFEPLAKLGWQVKEVSWRNPTNWNEFKAVIIRSTWDYHQHYEEFLKCLEAIEASTAILLNPLRMVKWNSAKTYLQDLEHHGIPIVPTIWPKTFDRENITEWTEHFQSSELIIKPIVGLGAEKIWRMTSSTANNTLEKIQSAHNKGNFMIQPFLTEIMTEGEFSLLYFDGNFSHALLKCPKSGDFRSQPGFGSKITRISPEPSLLRCAQRCFDGIRACGRETPLYARLDFIRHEQSLDGFALMELELIEPDLYFKLDSRSATAFAKAVDSRLKE